MAEHKGSASDAVDAAAQWGLDVMAGNLPRAHSTVLRLITQLHYGPRGLDALVSRCEEPGNSVSTRQTLTAALLRQLCSTSANGRGGRNASKYACVFGMTLRWADSPCDDERQAVYGYWLQNLRFRLFAVGALGGASKVPLLTQARFLADRLVASVQPEVVARYQECLGQEGLHGHVDDTMCWMFGATSVQTLWVSAQARESARAMQLAGTPDEVFMHTVTGQVQQAWTDAVDEFLKRWATADPQKLAISGPARQRTPWVAADRAQEMRASLCAAMQVQSPLEPYAAWQRQLVQGFLHHLTDCVFYTPRPSGVLAFSGASADATGQGPWVAAWATTSRPSAEQWCQEVWRGVDSGQVAEVPAEVRDALWLTAQAYWDGEGDDSVTSTATGSGDATAQVSVCRAYGRLPVAGDEAAMGWVREWLQDLPRTVVAWRDAGSEEGSASVPAPLGAPVALPVVPSELLDASLAGASSRFQVGPAPKYRSLAQAVFGEAGAHLVHDVYAWDSGFTTALRQALPQRPQAWAAGPLVALENEAASWLDRALSEQGQALLGRWLLENSPNALAEPSRYGPRVARLNMPDALSLAQWLCSSPAQEVRRDGFAWTLTELLNPARAFHLSVSPAVLGLSAGAQLDELTTRTLLEQPAQVLQGLGGVGRSLGYVNFEEPARLDAPLSLGAGLEGRTFLCGAHLWSRTTQVPEAPLALEPAQQSPFAMSLHIRWVIDVKPGQATGNTVLTREGRRQRTVDSVRALRMPMASSGQSLAQLFSQWLSATDHPGDLKQLVPQVLARLAQVALARRQAGRAGREHPTGQHVSLRETFREVQSGRAVLEAPVAGRGTVGLSSLRLDVVAAESRDLLPRKGRSALTPQETAKLRLSVQDRLHLGQFLRQARKTQGRSAHEVARKAFGLASAHAAVCRFERGCVPELPLARLQTLVAYYGLELEQVLSQCTDAKQAQALWAPGPLRRRGVRLRRLREALSLSTTAFLSWAALKELGRAGLERLEAGTEEPADELLRWICEVRPDAGLDLNWLRVQSD